MRPKSRLALLLFVCATLWGAGAAAQDKGTLNPQPLPPLAHPEDPATPARELFGRKTGPAPPNPRNASQSAG